MTDKILVTGGAGYIGSHTTLVLLEAGYDVVVLDNLINSSEESLRRIERICGKAPEYVEGDIRDHELLDELFCTQKINAVLHFAGLKAVSESVQRPLDYYDNNLVGTITLCQAMQQAGVQRIIFSSSATVYGEPSQMPVTEAAPTIAPTNPYGNTKLMIERVLHDLAATSPDWRIGILRYFNPVGAHDSGLIGEDPRGMPNNLLPYVAKVATGNLAELKIYGNDYKTKDGTGVRDYIHVMDLAEGHLAALQVITGRLGVHTWNLGTGRGYSVLEVVQAFEAASGQPIPYKFVARRCGDVAMCYADPTKAARELTWKAKRDLETMMKDTWRWHSQNPDGYL